MKKLSPITIIAGLIILIGGIYLIVFLLGEGASPENEVQSNFPESVIEDELENNNEIIIYSPERLDEEMTSEEKAEFNLAEDLNVKVRFRNAEGKIMTYEIIREVEGDVSELE